LNSIGQLVYKNSPEENETVIDISQLQTGLYFIQLIKEGKTQTKKIIKN